MENNLIEKAIESVNFAHAPYSNFRVGASLLAEDGQVFTGCNVENGSYGLTVCAERVAVWKAVSSGVKQFKTIVIASEVSPPATPCGACLQVLSEFGSDLKVILVNSNHDRNEFSLNDLLPHCFHLKRD